MSSYYETPCSVCSAILTVPLRFDGTSEHGQYAVNVSVNADDPRYLDLRRHFNNHPNGGGEPLPLAA